MRFSPGFSGGPGRRGGGPFCEVFCPAGASLFSRFLRFFPGFPGFRGWGFLCEVSFRIFGRPWNSVAPHILYRSPRCTVGSEKNVFNFFGLAGLKVSEIRKCRSRFLKRFFSFKNPNVKK